MFFTRFFTSWLGHFEWQLYAWDSHVYVCILFIICAACSNSRAQEYLSYSSQGHRVSLVVTFATKTGLEFPFLWEFFDPFASFSITSFTKGIKLAKWYSFRLCNQIDLDCNITSNTYWLCDFDISVSVVGLFCTPEFIYS